MFSSKNPPPKTHHLKPRHGFTIIELLVVVAIIGIVSLIIMASISNSKAKGRDSKRIADVSVIQLALERYYDEYKKYPASLGNLDNSVPKIDPSGNNYSFAALTSNNDAACSDVTCQSYHLGTTLELSNGVLDGDEDLDSDVPSDFDGDDSLGCGGESGKKCYDVIPKF